METSNDSPNYKQIERIFDLKTQQITPTKQEIGHLQNVVDKIRDAIFASQIPSSFQIDFIEPQGSTGLKQTALKKASDIDLFIGLDPKKVFEQNFSSKGKIRAYIKYIIKKNIRDWLIPVLREISLDNIRVSYAEHPYISANYQGIELDIIFCFNLSAEYLQKNGPITAMDRTPHHTKFVITHLTEKLRDEVRLFKYFLKCHHCYGDKSAVGRTGFIGYSAELLLIKFGSLYKLFENFSVLESQIINCLPTSSFLNHEFKHLSFQQIRSKYFPTDFLIILDPTDLSRNVGSSISPRAYYVIKDKITKFFQNPSISYFQKKPIPLFNDINFPIDQRVHYFYVEFQQIEEDHYTKFRDKLYSMMKSLKLNAEEESTHESRFQDIISELLFDVSMGKYVVAVYTSNPIISEYYIRKGPRIGNEPHYSKFLEKHPDAFPQSGYLYLKMKREYNNFHHFLENTINKFSIKNLEKVRVGCATEKNLSNFVQQSIVNLFLNLIPFKEKLEKTNQY